MELIAPESRSCRRTRSERRQSPVNYPRLTASPFAAVAASLSSDRGRLWHGQRLGTLAAMGGKGDRPVVDRWWVDHGKDAKGNPLPRPPATFGARFFRSGDGFEQDRARLRLTDSNLKWLEESAPAPDTWAIVHVLASERVPEARVEKVKAAFALPPGGRGVIIDSGTSLRLIVTGRPSGERLVEVRLGEESSFDAWVGGEWVREALFRNFDEGLRRAPALVREYLTTARAASLA